MRSKVVFAVLAILAFSPATLRAQEAPEQPQAPQLEAPPPGSAADRKQFVALQGCTNVYTLMNNLTPYGEQPLFSITTSVQSAANGQYYQGRGMFFVNQDTGSWTLVSLYPDPDQTACVITSGTDFVPWTDSRIRTGQ